MLEPPGYVPIQKPFNPYTVKVLCMAAHMYHRSMIDRWQEADRQMQESHCEPAFLSEPAV